MTDNYSYLAGDGGLFVQPDGPTSLHYYLGCHEVGDVAEPQGDITLLYCPDQTQSGKFRVKGSYQSAPGPVTTTITTEITSVADYLEQLKACPGALYVLKNKCGRRDDFFVQPNNRAYVFDTFTVTNRGLTSLLAKSPDAEGESMQTFDMSSHGLIRIWGIASKRVTVTETEDITGITSCSANQCASDCGVSTDICDSLYAGTIALAGSPTNTADVLESVDGGLTWAATATDPFGGGEDIQPLVCVKINSDTWRLIAGNGTAGAGLAETAYSDDGGDTWTNVLVTDGVNGEYFSTPNSIWALDKYHIWAVSYDAASNAINFSDDAGLTWTGQGEDVAAAAGLNAVHFCDENNGWVGGDTNTLARTDNGGDVWDAVAGPVAQAAENILTLWVINPNIVFLGYDDGELWYTKNGTANTPTWTQVTLLDAFTAITRIKFNNDYVGYFVGEASSVTHAIQRTFDGGYTWEAVLSPTNAGMNDLFICSNNKIVVTGDAVGGTGYIGISE